MGDICRQEIDTQKIKNRAQPVRARGQAGETEKPLQGGVRRLRWVKRKVLGPTGWWGPASTSENRAPATRPSTQQTAGLHLTACNNCPRVLPEGAGTVWLVQGAQSRTTRRPGAHSASRPAHDGGR